MITPFRQLGLTLIELTVVLLILVAMAGLVVPYISGTSNMAECTATDATIESASTAVLEETEDHMHIRIGKATISFTRDATGGHIEIGGRRRPFPNRIVTQ